MSAFGAWLLTTVLDYLRKFFQALFLSWWNKEQKDKAQEQSAEEAATKYEQVINKPDVTREEQRAAEDALLNRH